MWQNTGGSGNCHWEGLCVLPEVPCSTAVAGGNPSEVSGNELS